MASIGLVYSNHDSPSGTSKRIRLQQSGENIILTFNEHKLNTVEILEMVEKSRAEYVVTTADGSERTIEFFKSWSQQIQNLEERI